METIDAIRRKYPLLGEHLNELTRRFWAAAEAMALGYGGIAAVAEATGLPRRTIERGIEQISAKDAPPKNKRRQPGAGRKNAAEKQPGLLEALETPVEPLTRGGPESPLRWACKSTRRIADELRKGGWRISHVLVDTLLRKMDCSPQGNREAPEGNQHPGRNAQFEHINARVAEALDAGQPVIPVDAKKKELAGNCANHGKRWLKKGTAPKVDGHGFPDPDIPRAYPHGVYGLGADRGFVDVGTHHDAAAFAVRPILAWWTAAGSKQCPGAEHWAITADGGGGNGSRLRLWKWALRKLSNRLGLSISVLRFPPGASKWNKVGRRLFSFASSNWSGEPLIDYEAVANLIRRTTTKAGLKVRCRLDMGKHPLGRKVAGAEMESICLFPDKLHGEWNYCIRPNEDT